MQPKIVMCRLSMVERSSAVGFSRDQKLHMRCSGSSRIAHALLRHVGNYSYEHHTYGGHTHTQTWLVGPMVIIISVGLIPSQHREFGLSLLHMYPLVLLFVRWHPQSWITVLRPGSVPQVHIADMCTSLKYNYSPTSQQLPYHGVVSL